MIAKALVLIVLSVAVHELAAQEAKTPPQVSEQSPTTEKPSAEKAATEYKRIKPKEAAKHYGQKVTVTFKIKLATYLKNRRLCFLNSKADYKKAGNLAVVIKNPGIEAYMAIDVMEPDEHFKGKKIRVKGVISNYKGNPQLYVYDTKQIEIVAERDEPKDKDAVEDEAASEREATEAQTAPAVEKKPENSD